MKKYVYLFNEGNKDMTMLLGGKGANLAEMTLLGLPVPKGLTITTEACNLYYNENKILNENLKEEVREGIKKVEQETGKVLGSKENPLLLSVRSGSVVSMPGMMDTILNLGLNDEVVESLALKTNDRFAYDSYRRLIMMYLDVVEGCGRKECEEVLAEFKAKKGYQSDLDLTGEDLKTIVKMYKQIYFYKMKEEFPSNVYEQLFNAIKAVFNSWENERAIYYRKLNNIPEEYKTAVNIQEMVYGNWGDNSLTGVAFTRNPATGENEIYGEYLMDAQGEDVVSGVRTPLKMDTLKRTMPLIYEEFKKYAKILEAHYHNMQDMEFTVQDNKLYLLQTRIGKRTGRAAVKIAVDMVKEGLMSKEEAILSVEAKSLDSFLHKTFDDEALSKTHPIAHGLAASPGAASGHLYFNAKDAILAHQNGEEVILARSETSPEDIEGMHHASGVLTIHGGMTSHAAVVARGMGTCCVAGCEDIYIDEEKKILITKEGITLKEKDELSLDGTTGLIYPGILPKKDPELTPELQLFMSWADEVKSLKVRVNADTPHDALEAMKFGADGIGLCRTEHMFFEPSRIKSFRKMILAQSKEERQKYLKEILPYQEEDFYELFKICNHKAVVIRLLDPPLHEFLPKTDEDKISLASELGISMENLSLRLADLKEFNPMMGHRGCRLLITYPEITAMQTTAIIKSALRLEKENIKVTPEIMVPLVSDVKEFACVKNVICKTADDLIKEAGSTLKYEVGTMIELPRACLMAGEIAKKANFFSFGTNDLTQMTFGFSRDDAGKFLKYYEENNILKLDPFQKIDENGVGELMKYAIKEGRKVKKNMSIGVCGEQGGDPESISFFTSIKASYVSCSLYRVLISRLSCAQAALKEKKK